ncbi:MAG: acetyl-CoA synthetase, partial [Clostridiales bacterium]|nr:acetyl-CoA synthetase [Clostridiales bacterium]
MLERYLKKLQFDSYKDLVENFKITMPDNFNFAYDVVDKAAEETPEKIAMVWCDEKGAEKVFNYRQLKYYSDKTANFFKNAGIKKGDPVMLILKRRYEFWFCILALHKLGAITIPATHLLTTKDLVYRNNAANIKMIVCVNEPEVIHHIEESEEKSPSLVAKAVIQGSHEGWLDFTSELEMASDSFVRPVGEEASKNEDILLLYFTSGTTGMPKMVQHNYTYPLGHIFTAMFWQNVQDGGLHLTVADTGWAKAAWGKIYGQWLCGSAVFVYDYDKFVPSELLNVIIKHGVTSFCAPPTIYRFFIKEDLTKYNFSKLKHCSIAGEPLNPEVYNQFLKATGFKLMEGYGQTELTVCLATLPGMTPKPGSMGKPAPGYAIDLINDEGNSCEVGEEGQIILRTNIKKPFGMFDGYYRDPELTNKVW